MSCYYKHPFYIRERALDNTAPVLHFNVRSKSPHVLPFHNRCESSPVQCVALVLLMLLLSFCSSALAQSSSIGRDGAAALNSLTTDFQLLQELYDERLISRAVYERRRDRLLSLENVNSAEYRLPPVQKRNDAIADLRNQNVVRSNSATANKEGKRIALLIGNNNYESLPLLETPLNDTRAMAKVLSDAYGFDIILLHNVKRTELLSALAHYRDSLGVNDRLILYYAGHGIIDEVTQRGYWLPIDADARNPSNWISAVEISDLLYSIKAKHALVIADSCFSSSLLDQRYTAAGIDADAAGNRSRTLITSGGLEPVLDSGFGENSVFATAMLNALSDDVRNRSVSSLFERVRDDVLKQVDQTPHYGLIIGAGHTGGEFPLR